MNKCVSTVVFLSVFMSVLFIPVTFVADKLVILRLWMTAPIILRIFIHHYIGLHSGVSSLSLGPLFFFQIVVIV